MIITRRQFLKWAMASAAALGLSQTDLLKLEKAMADVSPCGCHDAPHVIWYQGQSCGGCTLSILNRMRTNFGDPTPLGGASGKVQDIVDLLVGDAVGALTTGVRTGWANFPDGYICLDYQSEVIAAAGNVITDYIENVRNSAEPYFVAISGAIPSKDDALIAAGKQPFCVVGSVDTDGSGKKERSITEVLEWLATGPGFQGCVAFGSCASWGGIPGAHGNKTRATSVYNYLVNIKGHRELAGAIINCPGCAPHPDWMIYPVAYMLLNPGELPPLDTSEVNLKLWKTNTISKRYIVPKNTPRAIYTADKGYSAFCEVCSKYSTSKLCSDLGGGDGSGKYTYQKEYCTRPQGCNGWMASPDCPTRRWNNFDIDSTDTTTDNRNQWCVGQRWIVGGNTVHTGANYVCQGCAEYDFPDGRSPFFSPDKGYPWDP
jgi:hydrogenase small subunit